MERLNLVSFYHLGHIVGRLLSVATSDTKLNNWRWSRAIELSKESLEVWKAVDTKVLPKTAKAATELLSAVEDFAKLLGGNRIPAQDESSPIVDGVHQFFK